MKKIKIHQKQLLHSRELNRVKLSVITHPIYINLELRGHRRQMAHTQVGIIILRQVEFSSLVCASATI